MSLTSWLPSFGSDSETSEDSDSGTGVTKDEYTWNDYLREYAPGSFRADEEQQVPSYDELPDDYQHDEFTPDTIQETLQSANAIGEALDDTLDRYTVDVQYEDEDSFFTTSNGVPTVTTRYDLEKAVPRDKKPHFVEIDRYWVNKPFAFIILFRSRKENEVKYFAVEPHLNKEEERVLQFLKSKLQDTIKFSEEVTRGERTDAERAAHIEEEAYKLLFRYDLVSGTPFDVDDENGDSDGSGRFSIPFLSNGDGVDDEDNADDGVGSEDPGRAGSNGSSDTASDGDEDDGGGLLSFNLSLRGNSDDDAESGGESIIDKLIAEEEKETADYDIQTVYTEPEALPELDGQAARPEVAVINEGTTKLTDYQVVKLVYYLKRDSVSYGAIDPIKHDISVEDISCDGYNQRVWAYHGDHEQIISNISHAKRELDDFVINLAQRAGQGISKRQPQVDITLPDGSRGQLTLGAEVSDHGTNYTIRQFKDVPFTPLDLISWKTFAPEQMAFLWLAIENHKSLIFAGGTASGKTTSLNAVSLFIPSNTKIVSIEDTREVELPQRNWVASVTRPSFTEDGVGEVDEFDLLEAALRQRPDYIVMGEIRGEEGRTLFQVMSTGHTTYTTFHADSVGEVIKRFTTDPINVSKTMFTALDLISIQTATRVDGSKVRRNKVLTEINDYTPETDEINVNDVYQWIAETDTFEQTEDSQVLDDIMFDRGWDEERLQREIRKREIVLAYLIRERLNTYTEVAATIQAFINGPEIILDLIANDLLQESLENLREMESVEIKIDPDKEEMVPRPEPPEEILEWAQGVLERGAEDILADRGGVDPDSDLADLLAEEDATNSETVARVNEQETAALLQKLDAEKQSRQETTQGESTGSDEESSDSADEFGSDDDLTGFVASGDPNPPDPEVTDSLPDVEDADPEDVVDGFITAVDGSESDEDSDDSGSTDSGEENSTLSGFAPGVIDGDSDDESDDTGSVNGGDDDGW